MTKNFIDVDFLFTGNSLKNIREQSPKKEKKIFKKTGKYVKQIGEVRHIVKDYVPKGHNLYTINKQFYDDYKNQKA